MRGRGGCLRPPTPKGFIVDGALGHGHMSCRVSFSLQLLMLRGVYIGQAPQGGEKFIQGLPAQDEATDFIAHMGSQVCEAAM